MKNLSKSEAESQIEEGDVQICEDEGGLYFRIHDRALAAIGVKPGEPVCITCDGPGQIKIGKALN